MWLREISNDKFWFQRSTFQYGEAGQIKNRNKAVVIEICPIYVDCGALYIIKPNELTIESTRLQNNYIRILWWRWMDRKIIPPSVEVSSDLAVSGSPGPGLSHLYCGRESCWLGCPHMSAVCPSPAGSSQQNRRLPPWARLATRTRLASISVSLCNKLRIRRTSGGVKKQNTGWMTAVWMRCFLFSCDIPPPWVNEVYLDSFKFLFPRI